MNVFCPHCSCQLRFGEKFKENLLQLKPGQKAKLKCTKCGEIFLLDVAAVKKTSPAVELVNLAAEVKPPDPPDVSWLEDGLFKDAEIVDDVPLAMILVPEECGRDEVVKVMAGLGYRAEVAQDGRWAMEKMAFVDYAAVILHTRFEPGGFQNGAFYRYIQKMNMSRRRYIFFAIIGKEMHTLYDLEALAYSANLVVNDRDVKYFGTILRKAIPDYEHLFGPLIEELRILGKA